MKGALSGKRAGDCPEPVFFHAMPTNFWADLIASYCLKKVVKLSAGDEACGMACMCRQQIVDVCCQKIAIVSTR